MIQFPEPNRATPRLPVQAYKTYGIWMPKRTHSRPATCEEVGCEQWRHGWRTRLPVDSDLATYIASGSHGRRFSEVPTGTAEREFIFPAGQRCFRSTQHTISLQREPVFTVRGGDWRATTSPVRRHVRAADFVEDWALNQQAIQEAHKRGSA